MDSSLSRRDLLKLLGAAGVGAVGIGPLLEACATGTSSPTSGNADSGNLVLMDLGYAEDFFRKQLAVFAQQYPKIKVNYTVFPNPSYNQTMIQNFIGGVTVDVLKARDSTVAAWAQYLKPIDSFPGVDAYKKDMFPYLLDAYTVNGKLYGLPAAATWDAFLYNSKMVSDAGFSGPPKTWDELTQQAIAIKKARITDFPIILWLKNFPGNNLDWWDLVYAHGGDMFDADNQPTYPDKDQTALTVLEWIIDGVYNTKVINPTVAELDYQGAVDAFSGARGAFVMMPDSLISSIKDPTKSSVVDVTKAAYTPGPTTDKYPSHSLGYSILYSMAASTKNPDASWTLMQFMGGKDKIGNYNTPIHQWSEISLGYEYQSLNNDPQIIKATSKYMDPQVFAMGNKLAKARGPVKAPWFNDWDVFHVGKLQEAILKKTSPQQALTDSANKARELAKGS